MPSSGFFLARYRPLGGAYVWQKAWSVIVQLGLGHIGEKSIMKRGFIRGFFFWLIKGRLWRSPKIYLCIKNPVLVPFDLCSSNYSTPPDLQPTQVLPHHTAPPHPALAIGGCSNLIQDTGTCLLCCEWIRPILRSGHAHIIHPAHLLCSAAANRLASPSQWGGSSYHSTKSWLLSSLYNGKTRNAIHAKYCKSLWIVQSD